MGSRSCGWGQGQGRGQGLGKWGQMIGRVYLGGVGAK